MSEPTIATLIPGERISLVTRHHIIVCCVESVRDRGEPGSGAHNCCNGTEEYSCEPTQSNLQPPESCACKALGGCEALSNRTDSLQAPMPGGCAAPVIHVSVEEELARS